MKLFLQLVVCFAVTLPCLAHEPEPKDPSVWDKSIAFGFNFTDGNSETLLLNLNAKASRDYRDNIWRFEVDGNLGESDTDEPGDDETTQKDISADAEYKRVLGERFYAGLGTNYLYDDVAGVDYRVTIKPVVGYFIVKRDTVRLSLDLGPGYVFEKLDGVKDDFFAPRISDRFEWDIGETSKLFQSAEYLFDASDTDKYIVNAEVGIEAALSSALSLVLTIKDTYDNQPADGRERNDVAVVSSLKLTL